MPTRIDQLRVELRQGTLDLLVLRTLPCGPAHGHASPKANERGSDDVLLVEQASRYPALHRLIKRGWMTSEDGTSENNRCAKFDRLTAKGPEATRDRNQQMGHTGGDGANPPPCRAGGVTS